MAVPVLHPPHTYHAFISYCPTFDTSNAKRILDVLEDRNFVCCFAERDFLPGSCTADLVVESIRRSQHVILVISPASLENEWSKFEMLMAVEDSHKRNSVCLVPVLIGGVKVASLQPPLPLLTCIELRENFENTEEIIQAINNHDERVKEWRREHDKKGKMSEKMFLLFPQSCRCRDSLSDENPLIEHVGHLPVITKNRAGTIARQYRNTIYSVHDEENEEYYFVGEYITVIHTMYEMEHNAATGLQTNEKYLQAMRFYRTIRDILERDPECSGKYKIIFYQDNNNSFVDIPKVICREIKRQIRKESQGDLSTETSLNSFNRSLSICGPDFGLYSIEIPTPSQMTKAEPNIYRDEQGNVKTVEREDQLTNLFTDPWSKETN
ncbi:stimulator of interferon genes protein-like isoform X2 [Ostrea edulis]|uniref:stimulator of interferon genes protein-like isoform X2 n=1 Tax=Ostrea edulis TaxID=37623 RepID=UPI0024AF0114|nr:stimulator of interferon genes protein-like isoform X2 [Ostrea edulis]